MFQKDGGVHMKWAAAITFMGLAAVTAMFWMIPKDDGQARSVLLGGLFTFGTAVVAYLQAKSNADQKKRDRRNDERHNEDY